MRITFKQNNFGQGTNRQVYKDGVMVATIHPHPRWRAEKLPDAWSLNWRTGRVDWFPTLRDLRDDALKA